VLAVGRAAYFGSLALPPGCIFFCQNSLYTNFMYLLYLDDSGSAGNVNEEYLVLGGICVFEPQVNYITTELDAIAQRIQPSNPDGVEFHASAIWAGRVPPFDAMSREERRAIIKEVLRVFASSYRWAKAFACAVHKPSYPNHDPMEIAFEDLCSRFDMMLGRLRDEATSHKGLIILDESTYETTLQRLARDFRTLGTRWNNVIRNIVDVPLFVDSQASRCVQVADHVAYAVFRRFESGDTNYLDPILSRFDYDGRIFHGLSHKHAQRMPGCMCPACLSRREVQIQAQLA
jgi:hypothetical protein